MKRKRRADTQIHAFFVFEMRKMIGACSQALFLSGSVRRSAAESPGKTSIKQIEADCCKTFGVLKANLLEADYIWKRITT